MNRDGERTILIVDDEEDLAELYAHYLEADYETRIALTSGEALVELTPAVDLMLLDRRLPGMSGDELLAHTEDWEVDCQVILVTAVDLDTDIIEMPFDGYLTKPVSSEELRTAVEQAFLVDQYEELLLEYYTLRKKYAALDAEIDGDETDGEGFDQLESRLDSVATDIESTLDRFPDEELSEALRDLHR
ncbi:response regulator [Halohasta salina]|uniref:response regulator n=1 Tax=Halohasta salina TaxID=2961621 RepID=UPI0020A4B3F6|nr:response regulator [Halohasta salina]